MPARRRATPTPAPTQDQAARLSRTIAQHLRFSPDAGHIQLFGQRMLLMHAQPFAHLRRELVQRLGLAKARELLMRLGYQQGFEDGQRLRALYPDDPAHALALGPRLRETEGFVGMRPMDEMRFDIERGEFWGDFIWAASWEAEAHVQQIGIGGEPACWIMSGYASGCCTAIIGMPIHWREVECVAMGHAHCRVIGKPLSEWNDLGEADTGFLKIDSFVATPTPAATVLDPAFGEFVGVSPGFNAVAHLVRRVAPTDSTVLFRGESGVGKERFARALHSISPRSGKPMISINCAAIPPELVEAELFGVEKGAFTGADQARAGRFERADGGTLFLDEIASLSMQAQGKVLRAIQEREIERVGGSQVRKVDVRIVAAANRDLRAEMEAGRFRPDLFYRLNVFPIEIPPLRERREDIPLLVSLFLERYSKRFGKPVGGLTPRANDALWDYDWPGNVRELENMVQRAVILAEPGGGIDVQHLFAGGEKLRAASFNLDPRGALVPAAPVTPDMQHRELADALIEALPSFEQIETLLVQRAMERSKGNVSAAARLLRLRRAQMEYRVKKKGIS
ncbi:MAG: phenol-degradation regulator [Panacagrimonas sp.]|jgi:DNA-binding NtrC family response regulator|nr:sigma-54-dependent Fis family transcriptional regulator [Panacagrimonas sp.]MCC2656391.1 phenol-degradation regulator [Panacagrimonas sp.]